jgi:hypothetical protein
MRKRGSEHSFARVISFKGGRIWRVKDGTNGQEREEPAQARHAPAPRSGPCYSSVTQHFRSVA